MGNAAHPLEHRAETERCPLVFADRLVGRREQLVQIGAGAEVPARSAEQNDANAGVEIGSLQRLMEGFDQLGVQRIPLVGPVEREAEDAGFERAEEHAHCGARRRASAGGTGISIRSNAVEYTLP